MSKSWLWLVGGAVVGGVVVAATRKPAKAATVPQPLYPPAPQLAPPPTALTPAPAPVPEPALPPVAPPLPPMAPPAPAKLRLTSNQVTAVAAAELVKGLDLAGQDGASSLIGLGYDAAQHAPLLAQFQQLARRAPVGTYLLAIDYHGATPPGPLPSLVFNPLQNAKRAPRSFSGTNCPTAADDMLERFMDWYAPVLPAITPPAAAAAPSQLPPTSRPVITTVAAAQSALLDLYGTKGGAHPLPAHFTANGKVGPDTVAAVLQFQQDWNDPASALHRLAQAPAGDTLKTDGQLDPATYRRLGDAWQRIMAAQQEAEADKTTAPPAPAAATAGEPVDASVDPAFPVTPDMPPEAAANTAAALTVAMDPSQHPFDD